ncbi:hypothetical protein BT96DRAFT_1009685 [Gymnopus androsaceus JB14]|uniref:Uncharacterized protein n=1 Tax=Gymnopus androsaceus JB14 TaxID=1447944 RepID=A0A6A4GCE0_9AGAR|nr:hypothetical protein BT96DRAFT_1009685 [Gymnopus androsaceus JB14]
MDAGEEKQNRKRQAEYDISLVTDKQQRDAKRQKKQDDEYQTLLSLDPVYVDPSSFPKKFMKADIVLQLNWHRTFSPARANVPKKSHCGDTCLKLLETLLKVMGEFWKAGRSIEECIRAIEGVDSQVEDQEDTQIEDEDMDDYDEHA